MKTIVTMIAPILFIIGGRATGAEHSILSERQRWITSKPAESITLVSTPLINMQPETKGAKWFLKIWCEIDSSKKRRFIVAITHVRGMDRGRIFGLNFTVKGGGKGASLARNYAGEDPMHIGVLDSKSIEAMTAGEPQVSITGDSIQLSGTIPNQIMRDLLSSVNAKTQ